MFVFTVLFSKYFEVHAELYGIRKFMFWKVGRDLKSLGTTVLRYLFYINSEHSDEWGWMNLTNLMK